jgi:carbon-monoxide dehydrogenase small subunit
MTGDDDRYAFVNGRRQQLPGDGRTLISWLRTDLRLTGPKHGCGRGHCGACSVLIDHQAAVACCVLATACADRDIRTVEGLSGEGGADPLFGAFLRAGAVQCGFCTPGMIIAARALLLAQAGRPLDSGTVRKGLAGNVCRCTGYAPIIAAVLEVAATEEARPCVA